MLREPDDILIRHALAGNRRAFDALYRRHREQIYRTLAPRILDRDTLDDLVQNTFLRAFQSLHTFKGQSAFATWLTQIALNVYRSHLRAQQTRKNWITQTEDPEHLTGIARHSSDTPEHLLQTQERAELVRKSIQALPEDYRKAMWLRYVLDWSYEEITHTLEVPAGTVKTWLSRARNQIKREFRKIGLQPG